MASSKVLFLVVLLYFIASHVVIARHILHIHKPASFPKHLEGSRNGDKLKGIHSVKKYLQRYGYLSNTNLNNATEDALLSFDDALESAVKSYQKFFKLNVSGVLDVETIGQMSKARCGVPDHHHLVEHRDNNSMGIDDSLYAFFPFNQRWPIWKLHLTYGFIHNYPTQYIRPVMQAFMTWEASTRFSFSQASRVQTADVLISFEKGDHGDGHSFEGEGEELAHAAAPTDGRLHFNADEPWAVGAYWGKYDVESVALHELGHILGLGHTTVRNAVMWPAMDSGSTRHILQQDDIDGIEALYNI